MRKKISILIVLFVLSSLHAQEGFYMNPKKDKVKIPFQLINNLIFISVELNSVPMTFLLDSGVHETILLGLEEHKEVDLYQTEMLLLRGLGSDEPVKAIKSKHNALQITKHLQDNHHTVLTVLDEDINFSTTVGIPVNGIIGYHFFKSFLVEIDYEKKVIWVRQQDAAINKRNYTPIPINIEDYKPYITATITSNNKLYPTSLLIDTGNSDAIWIYNRHTISLKLPIKNFDDYLGKGFSGHIYGKRAKIERFKLQNFVFEQPYVVFPDSASVNKIALLKNRTGSIGSEILRRFNMLIDYKNEYLYIKKNQYFNEPFTFNMSGLEIHHSGLQWVKQKSYEERSLVTFKDVAYYQRESQAPNYTFDLKPIYVVVSVRENSPADLAGIEVGDILYKINGKNAHNMTLQKINNLLKQNEGKLINIEVMRAKKRLIYSFKLKDVL